MENLKQGFFWNTLHQFGQFGIQFFATVILARILMPSDFGLLGIITIFINLATMLTDSGLAGYIIKKKDVEQIDFNTLFFYNILVSFILYLILFFLSPLIAGIYKDDKLISLIRIGALTILINSISIVQITRLLKYLKFKVLSIINLTSGCISLFGAIILAYLGFGVWALVFQQLIMSVSVTIISFAYNRYVPKIEFSFLSFKAQITFGFPLLVSNLIGVINNNIGNNIIAKISSLTFTGYYIQAQRLQNYPNLLICSIIDRTIFPIFSKIEDIDDLKLKAQELWTFCYALLFPVFVLIILNAKEIIILLLGDKWIASIWIFQVLMISSFPSLQKVLLRNFIKSTGYTNDIFKTELLAFVIFIISIVVGLISGNYIYILWGIILSQFISSLYMLYLIKHRVNLPMLYPFMNFVIYLIISFFPYMSILVFHMENSFMFKNSVYLFLLFILIIVFNRFTPFKGYSKLFNFLSRYRKKDIN